MFAGVGLPNAKIQFTEGGNTSEILDVDVDRWSFFEARDIVKELGFKSDFNLWWNLDGVGSLVHLRPLSEDEHASELSYSAIQNKSVAHVFVDHVGAVIDGVGSVSNQVTDNGIGDVGVGTGTDGVEPIGDEFVGGEDDGNNSDDSVKGIHFTDSEEDRTVGLDDGFGIEDGSQVGRRLTRKGRAKIQIRRNPFHGAGPSGSNGQGQDPSARGKAPATSATKRKTKPGKNSKSAVGEAVATTVAKGKTKQSQNTTAIGQGTAAYGATMGKCSQGQNTEVAATTANTLESQCSTLKNIGVRLEEVSMQAQNGSSNESMLPVLQEALAMYISVMETLTEDNREKGN
ncbi:hypothetical protein SESBI_42182 [Sesbania bispinosa]|nr:hypothetical protein SESBI_42182 [Sesbania bispinosa]